MPYPYLLPNYDPEDGLMTGFILFGTSAVHLHRMAAEEGFDYTYIWRVFNRQREPSLHYARRISKCLQMGLDAFLTELEKYPLETLGQETEP